MRHAKPTRSPVGVTARGFKSAALAALILGFTPLQAQAAESCNAAINIYGVDGPSTFFVGDTLTLKATIGAGQIRDSALPGEGADDNPFIDFTGLGYGLDCGGEKVMGSLSDCRPVGGGVGLTGHDIEFLGVTDTTCMTANDEPAEWPPFESNNIVAIPVLNGVIREYYKPKLGKGETCNVDVSFVVKDLHESTNWVTQALGVPFNNDTPGDPSDDMLGSCSNGLGAGDYAKATFQVQSCDIEVEKQVSLDGETWYDANDEGTALRLGPADGAFYRLVVKNTGTVDYVDDLHVVDSKLGVDTMVAPDFNEEGVMIIGGPGTFLEVAEACAEQLEIGEGFWDNTASVEGTCRAAGEGGISRVFAVDNDKAFINCLKSDPREASINIQKLTNGVDADDPANAPYIRQGDEVSWTYVVTNTGVEGLTIDSVIDDDVTVGDVTASCDKSFLASDEQAICTAKGVAGVDLYKNIATVKATSDFTSSKVQDDDPSHYFGMVAAIDLTKTPEPAIYSTVGETITYSFVVTNLSNVPLTNVTVTDPLPGLYGLVCDSDNLAANGSTGDSTTCTAKYDITQTDINAGQVDNTATATGTAPNGDKPTDTANATISTEALDNLTLVKTAVPLTYSAAGEVIAYSYELTNSGTRTLYKPYSVADDRTTVTCANQPDTLDPGESVTCTASYTILPADVAAESVTNEAIGTARNVDAVDVNSNKDTETVYYTGIAILKEIWDEDAQAFVATTGAADAPVQYWTSSAEYRITVENVGAVALSNVVVVDGNLGVNETIGDLAVGAKVVLGNGGLIDSLVWIDACSETKTVTNTATASGNAATSGQAVGSSDTAYLACVGKPGITVVKKVSTDDGVFFHDANLIEVDGEPVISDPAGPIEVGDGAIYQITVTNSGQVDLVDIEVSDSMIPNGPFEIALLGVGESVVIDENDWLDLNVASVCGSAGTFKNIATAVGTSDELEGDTDTDTDDANVVCIGDPSIEIVKEVSIDGGVNWQALDVPPYPTAVVDETAETALYRITVRNPDEKVTLVNVRVVDDKLGINYLIGALAPLEEVVLVAAGYAEEGQIELTELTVPDICGTRGEKVNIAVATGESQAGTPAEDQDSATVDCVDEPKIMLLKLVSADGINFSPDSATGLIPSDAYYRFEVTNTGSVALKNVTVSDPILGVTISVGTLAVGETKVVSHDASGDVVEPDLWVAGFCSEGNEGSWPNTALAYGESTTSDETAEDEDSALMICAVPVDICEENGGRPATLKLQYNGTTNSSNAQGEVASPPLAAYPVPVTIELYDKSQLEFTYYDVMVGDLLTVRGRWTQSGFIPTDVGVKFYDDQGNFLQAINFHGSCSAALNIGDKYAGVTIVGYTGGKDQ